LASSWNSSIAREQRLEDLLGLDPESGEAEQGHRTKHNWNRPLAQLLPTKVKDLEVVSEVRLEFTQLVNLRNQVVVIGVVPLGQAQRWDALRSAGHRKIAVQPFVATKTGWDQPEANSPIEDVVVQGRVADADPVDSRLALRGDPLLLDLPEARQQFGRLGFAIPIRLQSLLELALATDAGKTEGLGLMVLHDRLSD